MHENLTRTYRWFRVNISSFAERRIEVFSNVLHERESAQDCPAFKHWRAFALYESVAFTKLGEAYASAVKQRFVTHLMSQNSMLPDEVRQTGVFFPTVEPQFEVLESSELVRCVDVLGLCLEFPVQRRSPLLLRHF